MQRIHRIYVFVVILMYHLNISCFNPDTAVIMVSQSLQEVESTHLIELIGNRWLAVEIICVVKVQAD